MLQLCVCYKHVLLRSPGAPGQFHLLSPWLRHTREVILQLCDHPRHCRCPCPWHPHQGTSHRLPTLLRLFVMETNAATNLICSLSCSPVLRWQQSECPDLYRAEGDQEWLLHPTHGQGTGCAIWLEPKGVRALP